MGSYYIWSHGDCTGRTANIICRIEKEGNAIALQHISALVLDAIYYIYSTMYFMCGLYIHTYIHTYTYTYM
jgi:hypothetical protein